VNDTARQCFDIDYALYKSFLVSAGGHGPYILTASYGAISGRLETSFGNSSFT
jgi:hypothetical protein